MPQQYFITGTGTGVGKTVLSALLCAALDACYWKPIQTGASEDSDSRTVATLAGLPAHRVIPETYCFDPPVSPHLAAKMARAEIVTEKIRIPEDIRAGDLIVEGAGGVLVPINGSDLMVNLMRQLALPVILASQTSLGTINHTLLSLRALASEKIEIAGVVMIGEPNRENRNAIEKYGRARILGEIPRFERMNRDALLQTFSTGFDTEFFSQNAMSPRAKRAP